MSSRTFNATLFFESPRLQMTFVGRLVVRLVGYVSYLTLAVAAFTFLLSDLAWVFWIGALLALFLLDRLVHFREGDRPIPEMPRSGRVNLVGYLTPQAISLLERAFDRSGLIRSSFLLEACRQLSAVREVREALERLDVPPEEFREKLESLLDGSRKDSSHPKQERLTQAAELVGAAYPLAYENGHRFIEAGDLFAALPHLREAGLTRLFEVFAIERTDVNRALTLSRLRRTGWFRPRAQSLLLEYQRGLRHRVMNRAWTARPTPTLDAVSTDFTELARRGGIGFLVGHEEEYRRLLETLARPVNPNVLLVGESGVGKTTLVGHLALAIVKDRVPEPLFDKRLIALSLPDLVAGAPETELQERIRRVAEEILLAGNILLYIPEIHNLVKTSGTAYLSAADAFMPIVKNNVFPIIGTTYPREFKQLIEPRSDFAGLFEVIRVEEMSEADAQKLLVYESVLLERETGARISFGAVKTAVKLAKKFLHNRPVTVGAEELLKSALVSVRQAGERLVGPAAVIRAAEEKTKIPIHEAERGEAESLLRLEERIHERLVNQEEAVKVVSDALRAHRAGLSRPKGPIASFLFVGPTGVGKTELAKALSRIHFGSEEAMLRLDMTEYQDKQSFFRLIGSPDGEVRGELTDAVRERPYSLVLLDEFEKAFPDILHLFLQVFDDGRLTDNAGRTADFTNTILIATSNAQSQLVHESLRHGQTMLQITEYLKEKLTEVFRPELLNRFSKIVVFRDLAPKEIEAVARLNLSELAATLSEQGIAFTFDAEAVALVAKLGYDPTFGARPLRRVIEEKIKAPLAEQLLKREVKRGGTLALVARDGRFEVVSTKSGR